MGDKKDSAIRVRASTSLPSDFSDRSVPRIRRCTSYYELGNVNRDWLSDERKILKLEARYQRKTSLGSHLVLRPPLFPPITDLETLGDSSRDFHSRFGRKWGVFQVALPFLVTPETTAKLLYSRIAGRIVGTVVASIFALLGSLLWFGSAKVVSVDIPYNVGQSSVDFEIPSFVKAPTYVYSYLTGFHQNAKDFVNSQPKYLGRGFHCSGYELAGQFCSMRPNFKAPLLGNRTFCDLPSDTKLSPCGLNALWIVYDEYSLNYLSGEITGQRQLGLAGSMERSPLISDNQTANQERRLEKGKGSEQQKTAREGKRMSRPDEIVASTSLLSTIRTRRRLADVLNRRSRRLEPLKEQETQTGENAIDIRSEAVDLLDSYQRRVSYPYESALIFKHQTDNGALPWLANDDLRWYLWRRTAPAARFTKLYGRISQDLQAGTYRLNFLVNEYPTSMSITKAVRITGSLAMFGSSQFVLSILCFVLTVLYFSLWLI